MYGTLSAGEFLVENVNHEYKYHEHPEEARVQGDGLKLEDNVSNSQPECRDTVLV